MLRDTSVKSKRNIDLNQSEYRPLVVNPDEIKKIRKRENIKSFLDGKIYLLIMFTFTIYVLFSDDFRILVASKSSDDVFYAITIVAFLFFVLDIFCIFYFKRKYVRTLSLWLDVVSALSILLDVGWIYEGFYDDKVSLAHRSISPAARASVTWKSAVRYLTVMRYIRLIRLNGILKIFDTLEAKYYKKKEKTSYYKRSSKEYMKENDLEASTAEEMDVNRIFLNKKKFLVYPSFDFDKSLKAELYKQSTDVKELQKGEVKSTSRDFSMNNIRRVLYLILVLIVFIPLFIINNFYYDFEPANSGLNSSLFRIVHPQMSKNFGAVVDSYNSLVEGTSGTLVMTTIYQKNPSGSFNVAYQQRNITSNLTETEYMYENRLIEQKVYMYPADMSSPELYDWYILSIYDNKKMIYQNAALGLGRTFFMLLILFIGIYFFQSDAQKLLLGPFEEMMIKIKKIEQNPMKAAKDSKEEMIALEKILETNRWKRIEHAEKERYETSVLINTLIKSGELLALGFGEAGTEIIIEKLNSTRKRENNKVICIFGFCDIRHFSEATDELREDIMMFVNEIAEIISTIVDENTGSTNKNIGEAFLLVWKFRESDIINVFDHDPDGEIRKNIKLKEYVDYNNPITSRCELALLSFLQSIIVIHTSPTLNKYKNNPLLTRRIPGFKVKMGFGLHIGWAIEGAIGSDHKIDASYLSPNVNLASRLQAATKQFGVHILVSGDIYGLLSPEIKKLMRLVDVVNLKGSKLAMKLYTYDMYLKDIPIDTMPELKDKDREIYKKLQKKRLFEYRKRVQKIHAEFFNGRISGKKFFFADSSIMLARKRFKKSFYDIWEEGFNAYVNGDWAYARVNFMKTRSMIKDYIDGPSNVILGYMESLNFVAPEDWNGVRHLYSK